MKQSFVEQNSTLTATCLVFCLILPGFAQQTPPPPANPPSATEPQQAQPQPKPAAPANSAGPSAGAPVDSNSYKVGASDILLIRVWNEPEFSGPVAVQQNGNFTLPLVGDLPAAGKTPIEIQAVIAKALTRYVVKPLVTVTVQEVGSKKYYMDGMIAHPGEYGLVTPISVLEAISKAGGTLDFANTKRIYILRGNKRIYFNLKDVLHGKHMEQNIPIEPGDHIVVP
jgi:polysaccharide biosynthesis/export protein